MDRSSVRRVTVDEDPRALLSKQIYIESTGKIWHDLDFVHEALQAHGLKRPKNQWRLDIKRYWRRLHVATTEYFLRQKDDGLDVLWNICTTYALYVLLWACIMYGRAQNVSNACRRYLQTACVRMLETQVVRPCADAGREIPHTLARLKVTPCGNFVHGLSSLLQLLPRRKQQAIIGCWFALVSVDMVADTLDSDRQTFMDVLTLVSFGYRECKLKNPNVDLLNLLLELGRGMFQCLAHQMDWYICEVYMSSHPTDKPAPSLRGDGLRRAYVKVSPEVIFDTMQEAIRTGISLPQLVDSKRQDRSHGCAAVTSQFWMHKYHDLYCSRRAVCFRGVRHLSMVCDPSTHSRQEIMISLVYSWEAGLAACGDLQRIPPCSPILPTEAALPEELACRLAEGRQERNAAFRELQAISNCIAQLGSNEFSGIDDFSLPDGISLDPVTDNQVRVVVNDVAWKVDREDHTSRTCVWPDALAQTQCKVLTLGLDQGSVGTAGVAFASMSLGRLIFARWDKYHRVVRDIKLAIGGPLAGVFLKTQLYTSYLWGLNYKPFGTGAFAIQKQHILNVFLATRTAESPVFLKYVERIARSANERRTRGLPRMRWATQQDRQEVFDSIPELASSFLQALSLPKLGRWFSWNGCAEEQMCEYWVAKMLLESAFDDVPDPDLDSTSFDDIQNVGRARSAAAQLAAMRKLGGGLRLAYKLMSTTLLDYAKILQTVTRSCWSWYARQVKNVKSPTEGLQDALALTQGNWSREKHLRDLIYESFESHTNLDYMGISCGCGDKSRKLFSLGARVLSNRCWSMAVRHHGPPDIYVGVLSSSQAKREWAIARLKNDWNKLMLLENRRATSPPAMDLWKDLIACKNNVVRLMFCAFERDQFRADSVEGCRLLHAVLDVLPDNKIVEDAHNDIRKNCTKQGVSKKRSPHRLQHVFLNESLFEKRNIRHTAKVSREYFVREYPNALAQSQGARFKCQAHRMTEKWYEILRKKTWKTISEVTLRTDVAAWTWLQSGHTLASAEQAVSLRAAKFSKLAQPEMLLRRVSDGNHYLCLGNAVWAALVWPSEVLGMWYGNMRVLRLDPRGAAEFVHIVNPDEWEEVPFEALRLDVAIAPTHGIVMRQSKGRQSLIRACLERKEHGLGFEGLQELAKHLELPCANVNSVQLLKTIVEKVAGDDESWAKRVLALDNQVEGSTVASMARDPLVEAAFDELPDEDKADFPELKSVFRKKRVRQRLAEHLVDGARKRKRARDSARRVRRRLAAASSPGPSASAPAAAAAPAPAPDPALASAPAGAAGPEAHALASSQGDDASHPGAKAKAKAMLQVRNDDTAGRNWGKHFAIARTRRHGSLVALTVTCKFHKCEGRCNQWVTLNDEMSEAEAERRLKEWCLRGMSIVDNLGARKQHMDDKCKKYPISEVRSVEVLNAIAARIT